MSPFSFSSPSLLWLLAWLPAKAVTCSNIPPVLAIFFPRVEVLMQHCPSHHVATFCCCPMSAVTKQTFNSKCCWGFFLPPKSNYTTLLLMDCHSFCNFMTLLLISRTATHYISNQYDCFLWIDVAENASRLIMIQFLLWFVTSVRKSAKMLAIVFQRENGCLQIIFTENKNKQSNVFQEGRQ